jgi:hypothetical protein
MRIGGTPIPSSQALARPTPRALAPDASRRERPAPDRARDNAAPVREEQQAEQPQRFATPSPHLSRRGQRAVEAYTQHDVIERRAQYATLLGVDFYV